MQHKRLTTLFAHVRPIEDAGEAIAHFKALQQAYEAAAKKPKNNDYLSYAAEIFRLAQQQYEPAIKWIDTHSECLKDLQNYLDKKTIGCSKF